MVEYLLSLLLAYRHVPLGGAQKEPSKTPNMRKVGVNGPESIGIFWAPNDTVIDKTCFIF